MAHIENCWAIEDRDYCHVIIGNIQFTMRPITAGEHIRVMDESRRPVTKKSDIQIFNDFAQAHGLDPNNLNQQQKMEAATTAALANMDDAVNIGKMMVLTVAAALGAMADRPGDGAGPGWGYASGELHAEPKLPEVTVENVMDLRKEVTDQLYTEYQRFFRVDPAAADSTE